MAMPSGCAPAGALTIGGFSNTPTRTTRGSDVAHARLVDISQSSQSFINIWRVTGLSVSQLSALGSSSINAVSTKLLLMECRLIGRPEI
jgi:hypothetical protein